jgi:DNA mismatch endonuclease (patch repair protein)
MADHLTPERRSENMRRIRSGDTAPEIMVRRVLSALGLRYRLHDAKLPGKPDIVLRSRRIVIFVHGCFWHQHARCRHGRKPRSNETYWNAKLTANVSRDRRHARELRADGWSVLTIWECELSNPEKLLVRLSRLIHLPPGA